MINRNVGECITITGGNENFTPSCRVALSHRKEKTLEFFNYASSLEPNREHISVQISPETLQIFLDWAKGL